MTFWPAALGALGFIWNMLVNWLYIFISPIEDPRVLWILVPIWISWFFAEFFQEKKGTSMGNAISNAAVPLFVGIDWTRLITNTIIEQKLGFSWILAAKYSLCSVVILYGLTILYLGITGNKLIKHIGRIRIISYVLIIFTPIIYGIIPLSWTLIISIIVFFPIYYYLIELIDYLTPNPKALQIDIEEEASLGKKMSDESSSKPEYASSGISSMDEELDKELEGFKGFPRDK